MKVITTRDLCALTGYCQKTLSRERDAGRLQGEKRPGVKGHVYLVTNVRSWLRYKGLNSVILP